MRIYHGTVVHATQEEPCSVLEDHLLGVVNGKIIFLEESSKLAHLRDKYGFEQNDIITLSPSEFLMPGLIDTHIHAPQYVFTGTNLDLPLLKWLNTYTFPTESRFEDVEYAEDAYQKVVRRTLQNGTTTACYFATIHLDSTLKLCDIVENYGQRAYVGKVNMDQNAPDFYIEETAQSIKDTETFIQKTQERETDLVTPVVTPRFAISTTSQLLSGLGELVHTYNVPVQSHVSETRPECEWIKTLHPECKHYTDVYKSHGLLTNKTVMAHAVYLSEDELQVLRESGAGISHCPNSNISIRSGVFDSRRALNARVKCGLGTDVAGGYSPCVLDSMRHAVQMSNIISIREYPDHYKFLSMHEAFRMATLGGSQVLGLDEKIGNFEVGKDFDALRINTTVSSSPFDVFPQDSIQDIIHKFFLLGDDRNITEVFVAGRQVMSNSQSSINGCQSTNGSH